MSALVCSQCGAGLAPNATECSYCGTAYAARRDTRGAPRQHDCPRCHVALTPKRFARARVGYCRRCAGFWVPHDAMHQLLSLKKKDGRKLATLNDARRKGSKFKRRLRPGTARHDAAPARCPACHHSMRLQPATRDQGVYIDICDDHGTWFDRSELATINDRYARDTLRRSAGGRDSGYRDRGYASDSDWSVGGGLYLLGAVVELIGEGLDFLD